MSDRSDDPNPSGSDETGMGCTTPNVIQPLVPPELETAERLMAMWRELMGDSPPPPGRSLSELRLLLIEHEFKAAYLDHIVLALANLITMNGHFTKGLKEIRRVTYKEIIDFHKILVAAEGALGNPPISVSESRGKFFVKKNEGNITVKKVSMKKDKFSLTDVDEDWKKLVLSAKSDLRIIINHAESFINNNTPDLGGRPKLDLKVGFTTSLMYMWAEGTGKEVNLSTQKHSFSHFAHDVCCCYPVQFTEGQTKWAVRQALTQSKNQMKQNMISETSSILERPPHDLAPEVARETAIKIVNKYIAEQKGRSGSGATKRT